MNVPKQSEELSQTGQFSGSFFLPSQTREIQKLDAFHILHAFRGWSFLLLSSIGESKFKRVFGHIALKKVFVDQSKKKIIPFAKCRQKLNITRIIRIYEILKLS
jgi:hypothetical protein